VDKRRSILWQSLVVPGMERFVFEANDQGYGLSGLIVRAYENVPYVARYTIQVDQEWNTRDAGVELGNGVQRAIRLRSDGAGTWSLDGKHIPELDGCLDVDLEWSPSTNTLPIRRLALMPGERKGVGAAWVRFPALTVERLDQRYERLEGDRYRYQSGSFTAELQVDDAAIVKQYGGVWQAVVASGDLS
jgi:uncharacterized protein